MKQHFQFIQKKDTAMLLKSIGTLLTLWYVTLWFSAVEIFFVTVH